MTGEETAVGTEYGGMIMGEIMCTSVDGVVGILRDNIEGTETEGEGTIIEDVRSIEVLGIVVIVKGVLPSYGGMMIGDAILLGLWLVAPVPVLGVLKLGKAILIEDVPRVTGDILLSVMVDGFMVIPVDRMVTDVTGFTSVYGGG